MFQLTEEEIENWKSQIVTLKDKMLLKKKKPETMRSQIVTASKRNVRFSPYVFTEHGIAMLSSVLKSKKAIDINIFIIRSFIKLREMLATDKELSEKIEKMERKSDRQFKLVFDVMQRLLDDGKKSKKLIGFE